MPDLDRCPNCGSDLPSHAPKGLCPRCLLRNVMDSEALSLSHPAGPGATIALDDGSRGSSVLDSIAASIGAVPRVLLRDTAPGETPSPVVNPSSPEMPAGPGRLRLLGEIARGGMGAVLKGRDPDLGRDLAVKVLLEQHHDNPEPLRRFVEEAQIAGQLQHPGVVPVYELGQFADSRPYFSMKLVKGRTLAELLEDRRVHFFGPSPHTLAGAVGPQQRTLHDSGLPRLLSTFEAVCQTVAYAHARGVIHRHLKPANVMLGSFGEVQVMDWGLAKVLPRRGGVVDDETSKPDAGQTVISTARGDSDTNISRAGSVLGTPAYMAPEQARGETDVLDERCDVFALGSILCEILTGRPAFTGRTSAEIRRKASRGDLSDALTRLDASGAESELAALARSCLAPEREDRPRDAGVVAGSIGAHLTGVQEKLRAAELARAAESARAEEALHTAKAAEARAIAEGRARRLTGALAASVLIAGMLGAAGWRWVELERMGRASALAARVNAALQEATRLRGQAQGAAVGDMAPWIEAVASAQKVTALLDSSVNPPLRRQAETLLADVTAEWKQAEAAVQAAERDRVLLDRLVDIRSAKEDDDDGSETDAAYVDAFRSAGLNLSVMSPEEVGTKIKTRPATVALAMTAAIDDWAAVRWTRRRDTAGAKRLLDAAQSADADPWRSKLRATLFQPDKEMRLTALRALADSAAYDELGAISLNLLGQVLTWAGDPSSAEKVLRRAQQRHPGDVWVNYALAWIPTVRDPANKSA